MKWHVSSSLFTKLDNFLQFVIYMVWWSLGNKKLRFLLISWSSKNKNYIFQSPNHVGINLKPHFLFKIGYYIVPSPFTALLMTIPAWKIIDKWNWIINEIHLLSIVQYSFFFTKNTSLTVYYSKGNKKDIRFYVNKNMDITILSSNHFCYCTWKLNRPSKPSDVGRQPMTQVALPQFVLPLIYFQKGRK